MYLRLGLIALWLTREQIDESMPSIFKEKYQNTRVVIDCTELFCETPSSLELRGNLYSNYKGRETYKGLIGITPSGALSFISQLYPGSLSDREIVERSGLLNPEFFCKGDEIMADKGFEIRDLTDKLGVKLNLPAFLGSREQVEIDEVINNQKIASVRIHVERCISELKNFRLFDRPIPLIMHGCINQIWTVCAILVNFHTPIISA